MTKTLISFGHGYSATALTDRLLAQDWEVHGTTRSSARSGTIRTSGVTPIVLQAPEADAQVQAVLTKATHVLISAGPDTDGDPTLRRFAPLFAQARHLEWVGYLSTTGVYGDHQGGWVDEATPLTPSTRRGKWRVAAEQEWQSLDLPLHIFRLAGIYGPGRGPFAKVRNGTARRIIKQNQVFSRIHVADIAQVLRASIRQPNPGAIYNVCDDLAAPPEDVIAHAAKLLGLPIPPAIPIDEAEMTPMARSFYAESKRVRNDRIKDELGVSLTYPDYRTGLAALVSSG